MRVKFRVKQYTEIVGYILEIVYSEQEIFIAKTETKNYKPYNVDILSNGQWRAKKGYCIKTIDIKDIHIYHQMEIITHWTYSIKNGV